MELKPCPFCGSTDISSGEVLGQYPNGGYYKQSMCRGCCALGPEVSGQSDHAADLAWNVRASIPEPKSPHWDLIPANSSRIPDDDWLDAREDES